MRAVAAMLLATSLLCSCASTLSGVEGKSGFSCKAPDGVVCSSLSGVYANAAAGNLPGSRKPGTAIGSADAVAKGKSPEYVPATGEPIRSTPTVLRLWLAPWEDADGDLHDASYLYVLADPGRWLIEHNQKQIIDRYRPVFVRPASAAPMPPSPSAPGMPSNEARSPAPSSGGQE